MRDKKARAAITAIADHFGDPKLLDRVSRDSLFSGPMVSTRFRDPTMDLVCALLDHLGLEYFHIPGVAPQVGIRKKRRQKQSKLCPRGYVIHGPGIRNLKSHPGYKSYL